LRCACSSLICVVKAPHIAFYISFEKAPAGPCFIGDELICPSQYILDTVLPLTEVPIPALTCRTISFLETCCGSLASSFSFSWILVVANLIASDSSFCLFTFSASALCFCFEVCLLFAGLLIDVLPVTAVSMD